MAIANLPHGNDHLTNMLINNLTNAIIFINDKGQTVYVSPSTEQELGYTPEFLTENDFSNLVHLEDRIKIIEEMASLLTGSKEVKKVRCRFLHGTGSFIWVYVTFKGLYHHGQFQGIILNIEDITSFINTEQELLLEKERAQQFLDVAGVILVVINREEKIELINKKGCQILGYSEEELIGENWFDKCIPSHLRSRVKLMYQRVFNDKMEPFSSVESVVVTKDGEERTISWSNVGIIGKDGHYCAILQSGEDITEKKWVTRQLKKSEEYNRSIVKAIPDLSIRVSQDGDILDVLTINEELLLAPVEQFLEKKITDFLPNPLANTIMEKIQKVVFSGALETLEDVHLEIKGIERWFEVRMVYAGSGEIIALIRDFTEKKKAQKAIKEYTDMLEQQNNQINSLYQRLAQEIMQAKIIHERTLPNTFPVISGVSFAKHYQPAENIGGDFYDIVHLGNKVVMYVSDVSGHGLDSAFLSAFVKNTVDGYMTLCNSQEISAQGILEYLAKQYGKSGYPEEFFISMFVAVFNLETNILTYCGAGFQEEPLACLAGQENITLPAPGLPISLALPPEVLVFEENSLFIPPNSTLLIYSDGLAEQEVGGICYREFLKETFNKFCSLSAHELIEAINENFLNFNGSLQGKDDITFIVFKT